MRERLTIAVIVVIVLLSGIQASAEDAQDPDLAIIAENHTKVHALTTDDLRRLLLGEKPAWARSDKVSVVLFGAGTPQFRTLLKTVCRMSEADYKRYFIQMSFEGKPVTPPLLTRSSKAARAYVASTPGTIGVVQRADADPSVKLLLLDGVAPGEPGYKLSAAQ